jgi:uncharacterized membrane protein
VTNFIEWKICYLLALALIMAAEHGLFAARWKRYERARWTMGVFTIFVLAAPLALAGIIDLTTTLWLFAGFGIAGAVSAALYTDESASLNDEAKRKITQTPK